MSNASRYGQVWKEILQLRYTFSITSEAIYADKENIFQYSVNEIDCYVLPFWCMEIIYSLHFNSFKFNTILSLSDIIYLHLLFIEFLFFYFVNYLCSYTLLPKAIFSRVFLKSLLQLTREKDKKPERFIYMKQMLQTHLKLIFSFVIDKAELFQKFGSFKIRIWNNAEDVICTSNNIYKNILVMLLDNHKYLVVNSITEIFLMLL